MSTMGFMCSVCFAAILVYVSIFSSPANASTRQVQACSKNQKMSDDLKKAGISPSSAINFIIATLERNHIEQTVLSGLTLSQLEKLGISSLGDRLKIKKYFGNDGNNCVGIKTPCLHGGECKDGFKCFTCHCSEDYYGSRCETKCPCRNNGKCRSTITGFECACQPGYGGVLCEKQWLTEDRFTVLERQVKTLVSKLNETEKKLEEREKELQGQRKLLERVQAEHNGTRWTLTRVNEILNQLNKFNLHQKTPTYFQRIPICLPKNTKAILISIFLNFWNSGGHAYMDFVTYQDGNEKLGKVSVVNTHYQIYANTLYYELMLPWNNELPHQIVFKITGSYNTGGPNNWYRVGLVGYITA